MDYAHAALNWLNNNSGAVIVVVIIVYGVVTIFLLRESRNHTIATRKIFEASHRPYVSIKIVQTDSAGQDHMRVVMVFDNQGSVPANITTWEIKGSLMGEDDWELDVPLQDPIQTPTGKSIAPLQRELIHLNYMYTGLPDPESSFRLHGRVEYRGVASAIYITDIHAERIDSSWTSQGCTMT
ncbi:MAG: hypothetical protein OEN50_09835 [Deltaproteobacteria bacterium]|nr:hypothetical protein [Deltaproteobacteria bacterium]